MNKKRKKKYLKWMRKELKRIGFRQINVGAQNYYGQHRIVERWIREETR